MKLAVVIVHYRTPELLRPACEALVRDAEGSGIELEGVVVDNGSRPQDRSLLEALPFPRLEVGRNLGYAGGANLGLRRTAAELAAVMNPDVSVLPGCLAALAAALDAGAAAAGPRFWWDRGRRFLLPPTETVSRRSELLGLLAERGGRWARPGRRRWRRHARRHWLAAAPLRSYALSGALLAFRRDAWRRIGPFDEGYRLYFEETDWLQRLRAAGLEARYVPAAEAVHLYAQSVPRQGRAGAWFLESNRRFRRRVFGRTFTALLERLGRRVSVGRTAPDGTAGDLAARTAAWLEVSPSPKGYPAAGRRLEPPATLGDPRSELPAEIWRRLAAGTYFLRAVDEAGRELALTILEKETGSEIGPDGDLC